MNLNLVVQGKKNNELKIVITYYLFYDQTKDPREKYRYNVRKL